MAEIYERGLSLGVMSKAYGLPGLRIGWVATRDRRLLDRMNRLKHYLSICNSAPSEVLARIALKSRSQILERNRKLVAANLELCDTFFRKHSNLFEWHAVDGGYVAFPGYRGPGGAEGFCRALVEEAGILLLPPSIFASALTPTPVNRFRISFGRRAMGQMLERLDEYLERRF